MLLWREDGPRYAMGAAGGRTIFPTLVQLTSYIADMGFSLERAFNAPRIDAASPTIKVNIRAGEAAFARVASRFKAVQVEDVVYPVYFSVPTAVCRDPARGENRGMAHHNSPWAAVEEGTRP
jgi:gamma-glutamyltranspeptidase/glutathione hydrolase